jgi:hypothetical protein
LKEALGINLNSDLFKFKKAEAMKEEAEKLTTAEREANERKEEKLK